jgi:hypothetical protein
MALMPLVDRRAAGKEWNFPFSARYSATWMKHSSPVST